MRSPIALGALTLLLPLLTAIPATAATGLHVHDGRLYESSGTEFVMRGVNHAHTWYPGETSSFANIKATGANTVRVVLSNGVRWTRNSGADVSNVISLCKANKLICVLEVHDTTGYGEQSGASSLAQATDYWLSADIKAALAGQEDYVILNVGNEPFGNTGYQNWTAHSSQAIQRLRAGGYDHVIMVDAPNWGQDWSFTMRDNAAQVYAADPTGNTMFSIHMYGVFDTVAEISAYLNAFVSAGLPILVGEFGHDHSDGNPDEDAIFATAQRLRLGYLAWSWSGNGGGVEYLDMVTAFNPAQLTPWGQRAVNGVDGIRATSREAAIYGGSADTTPPTAPGAPTASDATSSSVRLAWQAATDDVGVTRYEVVRIADGSESPAGTSTTASATISGLAASTTYSFAVYAFDAAGNRSPRSAPVTVTTTGGGGGCAVTYKVVNQWQGGFQGDVTIRNTGASPVAGWSLRWSFGDGQRISQMWNAGHTQSGAQVTAADAGWNGTIAPNGSAAFGFIGSWSGANSAPTAFALNGTTCSVT
ncbi:cellulase family glycosylhydrolase [Actinokineospora sp. NPDC004072]